MTERNQIPRRRVHLVAGNVQDAEDGASRLRRAGFDVDATPLTPQQVRTISPVPEAFVIDLSRAPSRGRDMALFIRQVPRTRHVPLVFVEGDPGKVAGIQRLLPDASYSTWATAARAVRRAMATPLKSPVVPGVFAPFAGVPVAQKLGIKPRSLLALVNAPAGFDRTLNLPEGVTVRHGARHPAGLTLWFCRSRGELEAGVTRMKPHARNGGLWILWPKRGDRAVPDLNQVVVRKTGLANGLVDFKIASVDALWSGLRFTTRKAG